jgi:protein phosphatase
LGKRTNNEDNYGIISGQTYVVCDGVGGSEKGEVASDIVVREIINAYHSSHIESINDLLPKIELNLSDYQSQFPESNGMATTLTLLHNRVNSIYVAWCGDSRIYQFRKGTIIFQSEDHSWVNDAIKVGILTKEEGINHPKSNIITRAVQGIHKPAEADERILTDVETDDYFLLCSDGILEAWNNEDLQALFYDAKDAKHITDQLMDHCSKGSKDNFTAIVFNVNVIVEENKIPIDPENTKEEVVVNHIEGSDSFPKKPLKIDTKKSQWLIISIVIVIFTIIYFLNKREVPNPKSIIEKDKKTIIVKTKKSNIKLKNDKKHN